jgi:hypothetical protein
MLCLLTPRLDVLAELTGEKRLEGAALEEAVVGMTASTMAAPTEPTAAAILIRADVRLRPDDRHGRAIGLRVLTASMPTYGRHPTGCT